VYRLQQSACIVAVSQSARITAVCLIHVDSRKQEKLKSVKSSWFQKFSVVYIEDNELHEEKNV